MKYLIAFLLICVGVEAHYIHKLYGFANSTITWGAFKQQEIKCVDQRLAYDNNSIFLLEHHGTRAGQRRWFKEHGLTDIANEWIYKEHHGGYEDWMPECEKFYTQFTCWELDVKSDISIDKCASNWGFSDIEKIQLKKDRKYFEPKGKKK